MCIKNFRPPQRSTHGTHVAAFECSATGPNFRCGCVPRFASVLSDANQVRVVAAGGSQRLHIPDQQRQMYLLREPSGRFQSTKVSASASISFFYWCCSSQPNLTGRYAYFSSLSPLTGDCMKELLTRPGNKKTPFWGACFLSDQLRRYHEAAPLEGVMLVIIVQANAMGEE